MTGAHATSGGDGAHAPDWGDRIAGLRGVAWWPIMKSGVSDPSYPPGLDYFQLQSETLWLLSRTADRSTGSREGHGLAKFIFALGSLGELRIRAEVII